MHAKLTCFLVLLVVALAPKQSAADPGVIKGKIVVPATAIAANAVVHLYTSAGKYMQAFCDSDGSFTLTGVPSGTHLLQAHLMGLYYPEIRIDISPKGNVLQAVFVSPNSKQPVNMPSPLLVKPFGELQYFEKRKPVDVWSFVKSPYGIMIVFSVFAIFIFPKIKVDPEEYKEMQEQMKSVTSGATGSSGNSGQQRIASK
mmetsp:Transcript_18390/g.39541  ORF Transcript_18390/g.39541 Transcript_18390/m.39541 type:complete len:200 (-) Transcript_18390:560-1159(-)